MAGRIAAVGLMDDNAVIADLLARIADRNECIERLETEVAALLDECAELRRALAE
jgi:hypothetical protein